MEKNFISMSREVEKLRAELANVDKKERGAANTGILLVCLLEFSYNLICIRSLYPYALNYIISKTQKGQSKLLSSKSPDSFLQKYF